MSDMPLSWPALLDDRAVIDQQLEQLGFFVREAKDPQTAPDNALLRGDDCVMGVGVLLGPGAATPALKAAAVRDLARTGVGAALAKARPANGPILVNVLTAANTCAVCGREDFAPRQDEAAELLAAALPAASRLRDGARFRAALAAIAYDLPGPAAAFAYGKPRAFKAGEEFGPNLQALIHYLAAAAAAGASAEDVDPAIRSAVSTFPHKLQDDQLRWGDLGWFGRIRFHRFGGAPLGEVTDRMFDYVRAL
ncbi:MAG TPA: hypothetical protein VF744_14035 [Beijerinckiaceae bacterium]|jgi:hypothetical protein